MSQTQRMLTALVLILLVIISAVGASYYFSQKAKDNIPTPVYTVEQEPALSDLRNLDLGEFLVNTADKKFHLCKAKIAIAFLGGEFFQKSLEARKNELRDVIQRILMRATKEELLRDYVDQWLHRDIVASLNSNLKIAGEKSRIYKAFVYEFLIQ